MNDDHIPVPMKHAPNTELLQVGHACEEVNAIVSEVKSDTAWLGSDVMVEVRH